MKNRRSAAVEVDAEQAIAATKNWLTRAVIGLTLCPFAKAVHLKDQIRYVVSTASEPQALLQELVTEMRLLAGADPQEVETTLLIHPGVLRDFLDFNDFLDIADMALAEESLDGVLQIASFHPDYQFAGTRAGAVENFTNRSPYPTLHLLRESSIEQAMQDTGDADKIVERNLKTMKALGLAGWRKLWTE